MVPRRASSASGPVLGRTSAKPVGTAMLRAPPPTAPRVRRTVATDARPSVG